MLNLYPSVASRDCAISLRIRYPDLSEEVTYFGVPCGDLLQA
jgi:hypothetical protein